MLTHGVKTTRDHWESTHTDIPRMRLPSPFVVSTRDIQQMLKQHIHTGMQVLEIGCAPSKQLAYVSKILGAKVSGIDYSTKGVQQSNDLFNALCINGDVRCEDVFKSSFHKHAFDVVYSIGLVEHFDDPTPIIRIHTEFLRPRGIALIAIPNYGGIYGWLQTRFDTENLAIHNLEMMQIENFRKLAPTKNVVNVKVTLFGRFNPWLVSWHRKMPSPLARMLCLGGNLAGLLQPFKINAICPMLLLKITVS